jgi:hypothetical protein
MEAMPELAPSGKNRFLGSSSVVTSIQYKPESITYTTYEPATDILRLKQKPAKITCDGSDIKPFNDTTKEGYIWKQLPEGGVLEIKHSGINMVILIR